MIKFKIAKHAFLLLICAVFVFLPGCEEKKDNYKNQSVVESGEQNESNSPLILPIGEIAEYFDEHPEERNHYTGG